MHAEERLEREVREQRQRVVQAADERLIGEVAEAGHREGVKVVRERRREGGEDGAVMFAEVEEGGRISQRLTVRKNEPRIVPHVVVAERVVEVLAAERERV